MAAFERCPEDAERGVQREQGARHVGLSIALVTRSLICCAWCHSRDVDGTGRGYRDRRAASNVSHGRGLPGSEFQDHRKDSSNPLGRIRDQPGLDQIRAAR